MKISALDAAAAIVVGSAASVAGGYLGGLTLGARDLGPKLAGFLGMLYGPAAGATGVIAGLAFAGLAPEESSS